MVIMNCIKCNRDAENVMLLKLPLESKYTKVHMRVVGNCVSEEYMCLPCVGFEYDEIYESLVDSVG